MRKKQQKKSLWPIILISLIGLIIGGVVVGLVTLNNLSAAVNSTDTQTQSFVIESGESVDAIGKKLQQQGLIKNPLVFKYTLRQTNLARFIQAGSFDLSPSMDVTQIAQALTKANFEQVSVTILEGWRREEAAQAIEASLTQAGIAFDADTFLALPSTKEGYLFPDTYFLPLQTTEQIVATTIEANFNQKIASIQNLIDQSSYSLDQILIMASIVEREARTDRAIVAGILWKRLENDWPLQADATLQYAKGYNRLTDEWWTPPLAVDKELDSAYNSYANPGLPPTPIANPSLSSIEAAANPTETDYWFYITDNNGNMHYGVTYDDHLININRYLK